MNMRNLKLILEYDGSAFFGFQRQPDHPTVQEALESALSKLFQKKIKISAASGRTDTGVHAEGQVVNFKIKSKLALLQIQKALNGMLPKEIAVKKIEEVSQDFHARYSVRSKTYEYQIWNDSVRSPLHRHQTYFFSTPLNISRMRKAAKLIEGRHDFRSFCTNGGVVRENTIRTIRRLKILKEDALIKIQIEADGFLYHMVRNIVGSLLEVGGKKMSLEDFKKILEARDRRQAGAMVPASGLTLTKVDY